MKDLAKYAWCFFLAALTLGIWTIPIVIVLVIVNIYLVKTPRLVQIETWEINPLFNGKSKQPRPRHHDGGKGNSQVDAKVSNLFYTAKRNPMLICVSVIGWF